MIAAIPSELKCNAYKTQGYISVSSKFYASLGNELLKLFNENCITVPTGVQAWKQFFPNSFVAWRTKFQKIYKITKDDKLRQFLI